KKARHGSTATRTTNSIGRCAMRRARCFNIGYLVCLLGMALLAIPAQAQNFAYVANGGFSSNSVSVFNTASNTVPATVPLGFFPSAVAIPPDGPRAYVTNTGTGNVSVIDTASNTVTATVALGTGTGPIGVAITPDGTRAYVVEFSLSQVAVIDT